MTASSPIPADVAARLRAAVDAAEPWLRAIDDATSARPPGPGKWSPREVVGHLVDSAANNHGRFVRAALGGPLVFPGYAQDEWVRLQGYADADWPALLALWAAYNRQLAAVIARVDPTVAARPHARHNLDEVAWADLRPGTAATLGWFMADYVDHMEHHLRQVRAATVPRDARGASTSSTPPR